MTDIQHRKIWGRRQGRPLKDGQKQLLNGLLPQVQITLPSHEQAGSFSVVPETFFPDKTEFCLEIGFGGGEHLAWRAEQSPSVGFFGCEPFITGVASLLGHMAERQLSNIRIIHDDARLFVRALPAACLDRLYILFPDPWPKKRHNKRRIVHDETIGDYARILKKGGHLIMATDIADYAQWMQDVLSKRSEFDLLHKGDRESMAQRGESWPITRYEQKGIEAGRGSEFFIYQRV